MPKSPSNSDLSSNYNEVIENVAINSPQFNKEVNQAIYYNSDNENTEFLTSKESYQSLFINSDKWWWLYTNKYIN